MLYQAELPALGLFIILHPFVKKVKRSKKACVELFPSKLRLGGASTLFFHLLKTKPKLGTKPNPRTKPRDRSRLGVCFSWWW